MMYKVTKKYARGTDILCAQFKNLAEAKAYVEEKLTEEALLKVNVIYRIYEAGELLSEQDANQFVPTASADSSAQGRGKGATFRPTPLNTTPRPPGTPQKWLIDDEEDEKK